jgi:fatty acid desaturase
MRILCSSTLIGEFFIIGFAGLVAMKDDDLSTATVWTVSGIAMFLCLALCGVITRPGGVALGWVLQIALIASGFAVPTMFFLGVVFAALWWASVHYGRKVDEAKARFAAQADSTTPDAA